MSSAPLTGLGASDGSKLLPIPWKWNGVKFTPSLENAMLSRWDESVPDQAMYRSPFQTASAGALMLDSRPGWIGVLNVVPFVEDAMLRVAFESVPFQA